MRFDVIALFPEMLEALYCGGVTARALQRGLVLLKTWNPRDFARNKHRQVDDRPYGGGPGMVMQVQPLRDAIRAAKAETNDP
ncbi:MAG: tRNA (guanosine(37)-N1)-methyltransferase TrmD, partial [Gammaproteobacteria bacterium]|nr:tRNA (guanosine(37)-N1)-methyltransferase TrmD [Gammaproteobacteria bacterium]